MTRMMKVVGLHVVLAATLTAQAAMASGAVVAAPDKSVLFWSLHKPSEQIAINVALSQCGERFGGGCVLEKSFSYGCIAVSRSNSHRRWGYAWRPSPEPAQYSAISACEATGAQSCSLQTTSCE